MRLGVDFSLSIEVYAPLEEDEAVQHIGMQHDALEELHRNVTQLHELLPQAHNLVVFALQGLHAPSIDLLQID
jgi:hypothetical protein